MKTSLATLALVVCSVASAQGLPAFPPDAPVPTAADITGFIKHKTFVGENLLYRRNKNGEMLTLKAQ